VTVDIAPTHWNYHHQGSRALRIEERWERFWALYARDAWEPETKALVCETLAPGDLFLDIGAWIGPVTLWALGCGAKVIAIEPDPVAAEELKRRVSPEVEIHECALGLKHGTAQLVAASAYGDAMSRIGTGGINVPLRTLPEILGGRQPRLAVMDIEGYELTILPEVAPYLASLGTMLVVALHTDLPDPAWIAGYSDVTIPLTARRGGKPHGRSNAVVARL